MNLNVKQSVSNEKRSSLGSDRIKELLELDGLFETVQGN